MIKKGKKIKAVFMLVLVILSIYGFRMMLINFFGFTSWSREWKTVTVILTFIFCFPIINDIFKDIIKINQDDFVNRNKK